MKRILFPLAILPLLAACSNNAAIRYEIKTDTQEQQYVSNLLFASMRVIERRMASLGEEIIDLELDRDADSTFINVVAKEQAALDVLTETITAPFTLEVMQETTDPNPDITVEGHGGFAKTGVDHTHIEWLQSAEESGGKGRVTIVFSETGRELMREVFRNNEGKNIGLFVRNQLVSKLLVETADLKDDIIITDIPSVDLAKVFADDVNVGIHVRFVPVE